jgi:soluble lytic murein transglycosylase
MQETFRPIASIVLAGVLVWGAATTARADHAGPADTAARDLVAATERDDAAATDLYARRIHDPLLAEYAKWLSFQRAKTRPSFADVTAFITAHPTWPRQRELRGVAEQAIGEENTHRSLAEWFATYPPVRGEGALAHLDALVSLGETAPVKALTQDYWVTRNFDAATEQQLLRRYGNHLTRKHHVARLDRLIWNRSQTAASRMLKRVDPGQAALARARIALLRQSGGVDGAITRVPTHLRDAPELWFERLQWRRRKNKNADALTILRDISTPRPYPELWAREGRILARRALLSGDYNNAVQLASGHGLERGGEFADSEFLAGWVRLAFLNEPKAAERHFDTLFNGVGFPISRARGAYWKARAANAQGNKPLATEYWQLATRHPTTFYGQHAARALGNDATTFTFVSPSDPIAHQKFVARELVQLVQKLHGLGAGKTLRTFLLHLSGLAETAEERLLVAQLAHESDRPREAVRAIKRLSQQDNLVGVAGYPLVPLPSPGSRTDPEAALVLAVIRQESGFDRTARSGAGARGMMQLIPGTAKRVSKTLSLPYSRSKLTADPQYNIRLGRAYLEQMLERFAGSAPLALAAYNAGPGRVDRWLRQYGDPRTDRIDMIDWIESIPFSETRNYVQRVSEAVPIYRHLLSGAQIADVGAVPLQ